MLNFPDSPTIGQVFSGNRSSWVWDGVKWAISANHPRYIMGCFVPGTIYTGQHLLVHRFSIDVTIPDEFGAYLGHVSQARSGVAVTADVVVQIMKALAASPGTFTSIGTITIAAGTYTGVFVTTGAELSFSDGDTLALIAPVLEDATFADFAATLVGYES